jgi:ABC-type sugar transport system ATPase subunit
MELTDLHAKLGATMIYVTHDQVEAMTMADKIVVLNGGKIEQVGSPMELYDHPNTAFVAGFIGSPKMNLFAAELVDEVGISTYGIRPEHLEISTTAGRWKGKIRHIERLGADSIIYLDVDKIDKIVVRVAGDLKASVGEILYASPMAGKEHKFA